jgi:hypothetical protein
MMHQIIPRLGVEPGHFASVHIRAFYEGIDARPDHQYTPLVHNALNCASIL